MRISAIELFLLELPLREPFVASHGQTTARTISVVRVSSETGQGWGECSALPAATYTAESAADSYEALAEKMAPLLLRGDVSSEEVPTLLGEHRDRPMAVAAMEMAVLDVELRAAGMSLARWFGVDQRSVPAGVSIGLDDIDATVTKARALAAEGYRRVKVKVQPGHDIDLVAALRRTLPTIELQIDANGAYGPADLEHLLQTIRIGVDAMEQPFPPATPEAARLLIERLSDSAPGSGPIPVVADEAVATMADAATLLSDGAMSGLSIKPARVGGLRAALALHNLCRDSGIAATAGGMLETGLGRHALAALAGLPGFTLTGDLSPAGRWLAIDPWPDLTMIDGRIAIRNEPGIAPAPDEGVLSTVTLDRRLIKAGS